eukprot:sb/3478012/
MVTTVTMVTMVITVTRFVTFYGVLLAFWHHSKISFKQLSASPITSLQEPTDTSKQPIRTLSLGHVTDYPPIRDQYFLIRPVLASLNHKCNPPARSQTLASPPSV